MPKTVKSVYLVSALPSNQITHTRNYDLKLVGGVCPITKALATMNCHDPKADLQHPYDRIEDLVVDALDRASAQGDTIHLTLKIEQDAPMWPEDALYILSERLGKKDNLFILDMSDIQPNLFNASSGKHVIEIYHA